MKKIIITETQLQMVLNNLITETDIEDINYNRAIQCFLNRKYKANLKIDGFIGDKTKALIERFQTEKKIYPVDGIWGGETFSKLNKAELEAFKQCASDYGDIFDKIGHFLGL